MIDVNTWQWSTEDGRLKVHDGGVALYKALLVQETEGLERAESRNEVITLLRKAMGLIEEALDYEDAPIPLPYAHLARACSHLAFCLSFAKGGNPSQESRQLYKRAIELGKPATDLYESTSGWDSSARYDFHFALALAHFYLEEFDAAGAELSRADGFKSEIAMFQDMANKMASAVNEIQNLPDSPAADSRKAKSGCFGTIMVLFSVVLMSLGFLWVSLT